MVTIKDYLGSLVSGINQARAMADVESANLAKLYLQDELLRNFSVPRFRASDIELTIPVAIQNIEEIPALDYEPIDNNRFNSITYQSLKDVSQRSSFDRKTSDQLQKMIGVNSDRLEKELKAGNNSEEGLSAYGLLVSKQFVEILERYNPAVFKEVIKLYDGNIEYLIDKSQGIMRERLVGEINEPTMKVLPECTKIIAEAAKLKEIPLENLIQIKMKISEEGMEWHTMQDDNGEVRTKLLPE